MGRRKQGSQSSTISTSLPPHQNVFFNVHVEHDKTQCSIRQNLTTWTVGVAEDIDDAIASAFSQHYGRPVMSSTRESFATFCWLSQHYFSLTNDHHPSSFHVSLGSKSVPPTEEDVDEAKDLGIWSRQELNKRSSEIMVSLNSKIKAQKPNTDPNPASPTRPPVINLHIDTDDDRHYIWNFAAFYAARKAIDFLIADRPVKWINDNKLTIQGNHNNVTVRTSAEPDGLSDIMDYEFSSQEIQWTLSADHMRIGHSMFLAPVRDAYLPTTDDDKPTKSKAEKQPKPQTSAPRPSGLTSLPDILKGTDINPKEARNALRKMKSPKPDHGRWEWDADTAQKIKQDIIKKVKELRK